MRKPSSCFSSSFVIVTALLTLMIASSLTAFGQQPPQTPPPAKPQEPAQQQQQQQTDDKYKINTALVTVPVTVTDPYGRFITGLKQRNFTVREDGVKQEIQDFFSTEEPFNVALLIDTSRSTRNKLGVIRKAALTFIKQLQPNDRVMIVSFDEKVNFISDFTSDHRELERAIHTLQSSYLTSLYDAIQRTVTEKLIPLKGRKAIVVLTDGVDTASKQGTFESTLELVASNGIASYAIQYETRNDGAPLMRPLYFPGQGFMPAGSVSSADRWRDADHESAVAQQQEQQERQPDAQKNKPIVNIPRPASPGITLPQPSTDAPPAEKPRSTNQVIYLNQAPKRDRYLIGTDYLRALATQSGALHIRAESIENTSFAFARIADELRHQYTLTYISSNENRDGAYRMISVNVSAPDSGVIVRTRQGYRAPKGETQ